MKILLDENFPLPLYHRLRAAGHDAEHIIVLGQRGIPDSAIRQRLPTARRVEIWLGALEEFLRTKPAGRLFDLYETGKILGWEIRESR